MPLLCAAFSSAALLGTTARGEGAPTRLLLVADRDDDDGDRRPDGEAARVAFSEDLVSLRPFVERARGGLVARLAGDEEGAVARLLVDGSPLAAGRPIPATAKRVELQGLRAGRGALELGGQHVDVRVLEVTAIDAAGRRVDLSRSHASLARTVPARAESERGLDDPDALRFVLAGVAADDLPSTVTVTSVTETGRLLDVQRDVPLAAVPCPFARADHPLACAATPLLRAVSDDIDRDHPASRSRSLRAELGGALELATPEGGKLQRIRVAGPRDTPLGPIERFRARLRVSIVRASAGAPAPMGGSDAGALALARRQVAWANALWGQCGISFGPPEELDVRLVAPPPPHLVAMGCKAGLPASGGEVRLRVEGREVKARVRRGALPVEAAHAVARAVIGAGFTARVSPNAMVAAGAHPSADVLVRRRDGAPAVVEPPASGALSTDATLGVCLGEVDLSDGLEHFTDNDAVAGTVEERTLLKALDDGDPSTLEVVLIPSFTGGGRIGESFITLDGGSIRNVVLEDRAGIRADRLSFALAHELGHVLLDDPGHPDDYGVDTPSRLMDADAANGTAFGPRRLVHAECARALRQSGPEAPVPLLRPWPLLPLERVVRRPGR